MRAQLAALLPRQCPVRLLGEQELCALARQRPLELLAQCAPRAEDQRLDRRHAHVHRLRDLGIAAALELAHHERRALVEREVAQRALDVLRRVRVVGLLDRHLRRVLEERHLLRPPLLLAESLTAHVVRDRDQPVPRRLRPLTVLHRAVGVHERCLGDVLGVGLVPQHGHRVAIDIRRVLAVDALELPVGSRRPRQDRRHRLEGCRSVGGLAECASPQGKRAQAPPGYALAAARFLFGRWIARPRATRPASLIASLSVGCAAMPSATVSTVDSASIATVPASIRSVTCGPTMTTPSSSPYFVSWIDLTQPTVSACITARAFATHGKTPTATSSPYCSRASASVRPTPAISGSV